jgi:arginase family enzyme
VIREVSVTRDTLEEQTEAIAEAPPVATDASSEAAAAPTLGPQPVSRAGRNALAVIWIDSHGDLNTHETSPSGNLWGMPFRMLLEGESSPGGQACRRA